MTWVHLDVVLIDGGERLVRNLAIWFPMDYATIHLEVILTLNRETLVMSASLELHARNRDNRHFPDDEPAAV